MPEITDISVDPANSDILYVSTWTCGLFRFDLKKGIPEHIIDPVFNMHKNLDQIHIRRQLVTKDSTLFLATSHGICYKKKGAEVFSAFTIHPEISKMPDENYIYSLVEDDSGFIWAATRKGIVKINPYSLEWKRISTKEAKVPDGLKDVIIDVTQNKRYIFFLRGPYANEGGNGLTIYDKVNTTFETYVFGEGNFKDYPSPKTASRIISWKDRYLVVSSDAGVVIFDPLTPNNYLTYSTYHGLNTDHLYDLAIDKHDRIWVQSEMGLNCINPGHELFTLGREKGLPNIETSALKILQDGRLVCGLSEHYLLIVNPELLPFRSHKSNLIKPVEVETEKGLIPLKSNIELPLGTRYLRLQFSDFSFSTFKSEAYTVSVIHNSDTIRYVSKSNQIELPNLEPGNYEFLIVRGNSSGLIQIINPHRFYELPWFRYSLSGFLILIFGLIIIKIQRNRFLKKQRISRLKLQLVEHEMKSLRSQMNDHFVFNALTGINRFIYDNEPEKATSYLYKFSRLLRNSLRGSRNEQISLQEELDSIKWYVELESLKFEHAPSLEIINESKQNIESILLPPMLIQPLVENAIRHGAERVNECIHIWIEIKEEKSSLLVINVIDNAPSFIENMDSPISQGLSMATKIIQERLEMLNEEAGIDSCKFGFERIVYSGFSASKSWLTLPLKLNSERIES